MKAAAVAVSVVLASALLAGCTAGGARSASYLRRPPCPDVRVGIRSGQRPATRELRRAHGPPPHCGGHPSRPRTRIWTNSAQRSSRLPAASAWPSPRSHRTSLVPACWSTRCRSLLLPCPGMPPSQMAANWLTLRSATTRRFPGLDHVHVAQVLVHDLRFTVSSPAPATVGEAIALEGILADALGNYDTRVGDGELELSYTGPLLSDKTVEAVRARRCPRRREHGRRRQGCPAVGHGHRRGHGQGAGGSGSCRGRRRGASTRPLSRAPVPKPTAVARAGRDISSQPGLHACEEVATAEGLPWRNLGPQKRVSGACGGSDNRHGSTFEG